MVVPSPGTLSIFIQPWLVWTISKQIFKPSPDPLSPLVPFVDMLAWESSNFEITSSGIPIPESRTDMTTSPVSTRGMLIFGAGCGILTMNDPIQEDYQEDCK